MTKPVDPLTDFDALRRVGIGYSQDASGEIWTDYNVHDPGVTLLEQTCFALSQIAYQADLPIRDLLTNPRKHFCFQDMALFRPRKVLGTSPVTRHDLAAWLCGCKGIDSVSIDPVNPARPGFYDVTIVPSALGEKHADAEAAFRRNFAEVRPLCTELGHVRISTPVKVTLTGTVEIGSETLPEIAAAHLYHRISHILSGMEREDQPARRADVWEAPERLLAPAQNRSAQSLDLSKHLAELRALPGIHDISALVLNPPKDWQNDPKDAVYFQVTRPRTDADIGLTLTLNGAPISLSAARIREEFIRISAETIAEAAHHIDVPDWEVMKPGRHRRFTHAHVDALLPMLYRAGTYRPDNPADPVNVYRDAIDTVLRDMVGTLSMLPRRFTARPESGGAARADDPVLHRLRVDLLDYLIALQGCDMPATRHSGLHCYMTTRARHRFDIDWRLEYLFALPALHNARATGPGPKTPGGFLAELALLCDLGVAKTVALTQPLQDYGLTLEAGKTLPSDPAAEKLTLVSAFSYHDMLVPEREGAELLDKDALADLSPFAPDGVLSPDMLAHLAAGDTFAMTPGGGDMWRILCDPGPHGPLRQVGTVRGKEAAQDTIARLRATWRHLNRACEGLYLVEHIRLAGAGPGRAHVADIMLVGWTARCQMKSYRSYVETLVETLAPAHVRIRVRWLDYPQTRLFEALATAAQDGDDAARAAYEAFLNDPEHGGSA